MAGHGTVENLSGHQFQRAERKAVRPNWVQEEVT